MTLYTFDPKSKSKSKNVELLRIIYIGLLYREPDPSGFNRYLALLEDGSIDEQQLVSDIKKSDEYKLLAKNSEIVTKCYLEVLYREPDPSGFNAFLDHLKNDAIDEQQLVSKLKKSDEYKISQAYLEIFGIKITEFDSDFFQNKLKSIVPLNYDKIKEKMKNSDLYEKFLYRNKFSQKYSTGKIYRYVD